jgi:hypothetical protein
LLLVNQGQLTCSQTNAGVAGGGTGVAPVQLGGDARLTIIRLRLRLQVKSVLNHVQDASAALPQNCQTTTG